MSKLHWSASRRPAEREWHTIQVSVHIIEAIGETPIAATATVALPDPTESFPLSVGSG